jgi:hypothetical protein
MKIKSKDYLPILILVIVLGGIIYLVNTQSDYDWENAKTFISDGELSYVRECYSYMGIPNANRPESYRYCYVTNETLGDLEILNSVKAIKICAINETTYTSEEIEACLVYSQNTVKQIEYTSSGVKPTTKVHSIYEYEGNYYSIKSTGGYAEPYHDVYILNKEQLKDLINLD